MGPFGNVCWAIASEPGSVFAYIQQGQAGIVMTLYSNSEEQTNLIVGNRRRDFPGRDPLLSVVLFKCLNKAA